MSPVERAGEARQIPVTATQLGPERSTVPIHALVDPPGFDPNAFLRRLDQALGLDLLGLDAVEAPAVDAQRATAPPATAPPSTARPVSGDGSPTHRLVADPDGRRAGAVATLDVVHGRWGVRITADRDDVGAATEDPAVDPSGAVEEAMAVFEAMGISRDSARWSIGLERGSVERTVVVAGQRLLDGRPFGEVNRHRAEFADADRLVAIDGDYRVPELVAESPLLDVDDALAAEAASIGARAIPVESLERAELRWELVRADASGRVHLVPAWFLPLDPVARIEISAIAVSWRDEAE
ncbi:MAG: hypothetical protein AAGG08_10250 [Actinomycetota bacterium]